MKPEMRPDAVKTSFVLHSNYLNQLDSLNLEDRGIWITAIFHYVNDLPLPEMDGTVSMFFSIVQDQLDRDYAKWLHTREARKSAGQAGGIASGISRRSKANASFGSKNEANEAVNVYVNENGNVNETVYVNDHHPYIHDRKQFLKEARRGMERDIDYDAVLLDQIRNRGSKSIPEPQDDDLEYLGIPVPEEGRWSE